jgi:quercetin dioxygenase-like cupin family protein
MKVVRIEDSAPQPANRPIFLGHVESQPLLDDVSEHVRLTVVRFSPGARTRLHTHSFEQVLLITEGKGILATESEQHVVTPGTVVVIPPGEPHTHGGTEDSAMAHISITTPGETRIIEQ